MLLGKQLSAAVAGAVPNYLFCLGQVVLRAGEPGLWCTGSLLSGSAGGGS